MREGFRESFKPLISQFEKPEDFDEEETEEVGKKKKEQRMYLLKI